MSDIYTFSGSGESNFISQGCFYLYDDFNTNSSWGSDVFPALETGVEVTATAIADLSGYVQITESTGDPETCTEGNLIVIDEGPLAGVHKIRECISSGIFTIDLEWETCFSDADEPTYTILTPGKTESNPGDVIIGDDVCMASPLPTTGVNSFVQYTSHEGMNWFCYSGTLNRCDWENFVTVEFSGDNSLDTHSVAFAQGSCIVTATHD